MIAVIEGPSAAGKTTWVEAHAGRSSVPEEPPSREPPTNQAAAAAFWVDHARRRWASALELERATGVAICDTDPLKLHYTWSLWRIGAGSSDGFEVQAEAYREAITRQRVGFADLYLVTIPDTETLASRRGLDANRRRRNFDLHVRLAAPLREWYAALEATRPGSVGWTLDARSIDASSARSDRYSLDDFDALLARLPAS